MMIITVIDNNYNSYLLSDKFMCIIWHVINILTPMFHSKAENEV